MFNCPRSLLIGTKFLGLAHCAIYGLVYKLVYNLGGSKEARLFWFTTWCFFLDAYFFFFCRCASFLSVFFYALWCDIRGHSKTTLTSFGLFFWPHTPLCWQFLPDKSWHFWATYPPFLVNVVCERPLKQSS